MLGWMASARSCKLTNSWNAVESKRSPGERTVLCGSLSDKAHSTRLLNRQPLACWFLENTTLFEQRIHIPY